MPLSPQKKLSLIQNIPDESYLRKEVLIPLFRNMSVFEQVIDNHGPNERGTDIILVEKATLGGYNYTSVIVKALPISNATSSRRDRETSANVIQQMTLAIVSGYDCNITTRHVNFNDILVITNQTISGTAKQSLIAEASNHRFSAIRFWDEEILVQKIDEYLPNFYYYQSGNHARIASALQQKCEQLSDLQNLPQFSVQERALIDVFVQPRLQHIGSKKFGKEHKNQVTIKTPDQILADHNRVLIVGEAGSGKSIIMRETVLSVLSENRRDTKPNLPLLVKAHDVARTKKTDLIGAINEFSKRYYNLDDFEFRDINDNTNTTLLIDGLDEIVDIEQRENFRKCLVEFGEAHPDIRMVVTSRRTQDITDLSAMLSYQRWEILPFNFSQIREFINKWFAERNDSNQRLLTALEDHELLSRLPSTPLVLTLLAILFDSDDYRELPSNLSELYQMFLDLLLGKWNLDRRVESMHAANIREYLAAEIAREMHREKVLAISRQDFAKIVTEVGTKRGLTLDPDYLISDFTEQTALLVFNDKNELEFRHLSFQEFLCASAVQKHPRNGEIDFLIQHFEDSWWTKVLYFYCGLCQDTPDILNRLANRLPEIEVPGRVTAVFELGYLVQAAYLSPIDSRMRTVELALRSFYNCLDSIKDVAIDEQSIPEGMIYFAFMSLLSIQYSSRMLQEHYRTLFYSLLNQPSHDATTAFVALSLAAFMAQNNDFQALAEVQGMVKAYIKQHLTLGLIGGHLLQDLSPQERRSKDVQEFKKTLNKVKKWFRERNDITRQLLQSSNPSLTQESNSETS